MRAIVVCAVLLLAVQFGFAQTAGPASLESLNFLLGVWTPEDWGHQAETTEFHWVERQGHALLVGRHWEADESGCPWCVTQAAMVSYYDLASNQVRVRFGDKTQRVDFALAVAVKCAHERRLIVNECKAPLLTPAPSVQCSGG